MDKYNDIKNESFVKYFLMDLHCRSELIQYCYPHEFLEDRNAIEEHVARCKGLLTDFITTSVIRSSVNKLENSDLKLLVDKKLDELYPLVEPYIKKYAEVVVVKYVSFYPDQE
ncbi:hypothetical protein [uncultured Flavobacterium sp.]|uniref:hypothetical protein n=1 Tax=uncultured Flavobacterium sp. TaxID=165435 RepID=UPI002598CA70|nr:hypothetical protein [uncultured Flavobacterium sp.]